ncbi:MAG: hypothetical protein V4678_03240 [Patescibacteria group bacterium]
MKFTAEQIRVRKNLEHKVNRATSEKLEKALIPDVGDAAELVEALKVLRTAKLPTEGGPYSQFVSTEMKALTLRFYSSRVDDFIGLKGTVNRRKAFTTGRVFKFNGPVRVMRERRGKDICYSLTDGKSSLALGELGAKDDCTYVLNRSSGFAEPTGRVACHRSMAWGPSPLSE